MLSVQQAATKAGRDPETVRRWIRSGKLRSQKIGTQHMIDETDLAFVLHSDTAAQIPHVWQRTWTGEPQPDWVSIIGRSRRDR